MISATTGEVDGVKYTRTPLHWWIYSASAERDAVIALLISKGANPFRAAEDGTDGFDMAAQLEPAAAAVDSAGEVDVESFVDPATKRSRRRSELGALGGAMLDARAKFVAGREIRATGGSHDEL